VEGIMAKLQHELHKKQPFTSREEEAALNLARTNDQLHIRFVRLFREHGGLTASQYNILRILRGEGAPMRCLDIAARTVTVVPGITGLVDRLTAAGLVERERSVRDRREVYVSITEKGLKVLADLDEPVLELNRRALGHLSREELAELIRLLEKARQGAGDEARRE
jgi:MarR family transcriptional regulator, 2-MHQ and catechol-resistance regulon repressor